MDENGSCKVIGIRQIVRLKEMLQKWQSVTIGSRNTESAGGSGSHNPEEISLNTNERLPAIKSCCDSDDESCHGTETPVDIPRGYLAVYVGPELRRFIIPTSYLSHSLFKRLLEKVEEEFGFDHTGALTIPCEIETFKYLLKCMEQQLPKQVHQSNPSSEGDEFIN